jgi:hypothetical protein
MQMPKAFINHPILRRYSLRADSVVKQFAMENDTDGDVNCDDTEFSGRLLKKPESERYVAPLSCQKSCVTRSGTQSHDHPRPGQPMC